MQTNRTSSFGTAAAILSMSVVQMGTTAIAPILSDIGMAFPTAEASSVQFLMTFPNLIVMVMSIVSAFLAKKVPKKWIAVLGCGLFVLSGLLSWLFHASLPVLFGWALLMGIGISMVVPMATSLVTDCFSGAQCQRFMGYQSSAANIGAMTMSFAGGLLASIHWSCNYLVYLIALPGFFLSIFCLSNHPISRSDPNEEQAGGPSVRLRDLLRNGSVVFGCVMALLVSMLFNLVPANLSMLLTERGLGSPAEAGTGTALLLLGGTLGGFAFGRLAQLLGRRVMALAFGMLTLGLFLLVTASNLPVVYIGCLLSGTCISTVMSQVMLDTAAHAKGNTELSSALALASSNLGSFSAPLLTVAAAAITGSGLVRDRLWVGAGCAALVCLFLLLVTGLRKSAAAKK